MEQKNVVLALVLSAVIIIGWGFLQPHLFPTPVAPPPQQQAPSTSALPSQTPTSGGTTGAPAVPGAGITTPPLEQLDRDSALAQSPRVPIESPKLKGSITLKGGRID